MRIGAIDIGSNTARLLVAEIGPDDSVTRVDVQRSYLRLGAEIELHGLIGPTRITEAAAVAGEYAARAESFGAEGLSVIVTAPGRQAASGKALVTTARTPRARHTRPRARSARRACRAP